MAEPNRALPAAPLPAPLSPPPDGDPIPCEYLLSKINRIADLPEPQLYVPRNKNSRVASTPLRLLQRAHINSSRPRGGPTRPIPATTTPISSENIHVSSTGGSKRAGYSTGPPNVSAYIQRLPTPIPASVLDMFEGSPEEAELAALELFKLINSSLGAKVNHSAAGPSLNAMPSSAALCLPVKLGQLTSNSALADSGARKCFIAHEIARWAEAHVRGARRELSEFPAAVVANAARVPILGKLTLPVTLGTHSYTADFYILPTCSYDLILGLDFFEKYDLSISDYASRVCIGKDNCIKRCECTRATPNTDTRATTASLAALTADTPQLEPFDTSNRFYEIYALRAEQLAPSGRALVHCTTKAPTNKNGIIHPLPNTRFTSCQYFFDSKRNDSSFDIEVTNLDPYMSLPIPRTTVIGFLELLEDCAYAKYTHDASGPALPSDGIEVNYIDTASISSYGAISPEAPVAFSATALASVEEVSEPPPPVPQRTPEEVRAALDAVQISGPPSLIAAIKEIINEIPNLFSLTGITRHMSNGTTAKIQVNADPEVARYSRWTDAATRNGKPLLFQLLQHGILEWAPADDARYRHAVFLKKKSTGKFRLLSDLRSVNKVLLLDRYPLPSVQQALDALSGSKYFAAVDVVDAFYSIPLDLASRKYLTFATPWGLMRYRVLAQGLATSPAIFTRAIHMTLGDTAWQKAIPYLDDILIHAKTEEEFLAALKEVLRRLDRDGWTLSANKCQFNLERLYYLGFIISKNGVEPDDRKVASIVNFPRPSNG